MSEHKKYTSIKLNARVYNTYKTRPNTIPHALGEFIDNAIGSYQQNKERLIENEPNYKLHIYINIEWVDKKTTKITIVTMLQAFPSTRIRQLSNLLTSPKTIKA